MNERTFQKCSFTTFLGFWLSEQPSARQENFDSGRTVTVHCATFLRTISTSTKKDGEQAPISIRPSKQRSSTKFTVPPHHQLKQIEIGEIHIILQERVMPTQGFSQSCRHFFAASSSSRRPDSFRPSCRRPQSNECAHDVTDLTSRDTVCPDFGSQSVTILKWYPCGQFQMSRFAQPE